MKLLKATGLVRLPGKLQATKVLFIEVEEKTSENLERCINLSNA